MRSPHLMFLLAIPLTVIGCGAWTDGLGASGSTPISSVLYMDITPSGGTIAVGETLQLTARIRDQDNNTRSGEIRWGLWEPSTFASVSETGLVTGIKAGGTTEIVAYGFTFRPMNRGRVTVTP